MDSGSLHRKTDSQTDAVVTAARVAEVTRGRTETLNVVSPQTATQHMEFALFWPLWINHVFFWIIAVPVLTPLQDIAVHVMKPPSVCWETAYWRGFFSISASHTVAIFRPQVRHVVSLSTFFI